jgi:hypothetical protein
MVQVEYGSVMAHLCAEHHLAALKRPIPLLPHPRQRLHFYTGQCSVRFIGEPWALR